MRHSKSTAAEIQTEIPALRNARAVALARAEAAKTTRVAEGLNLTAKALRELEDQQTDAELEARQTDAKLEALTGQLATALAAERAAGAKVDQDALEARLTQHEARWRAEYPALDAALRSLLAERRALHVAIATHNDESANHAVVGESLVEALLEVRLMQTDDERAEAARWKEFNRLTPEQQRLHEQAQRSRASNKQRGPLVMSDAPPQVTIEVGGIQKRGHAISLW